MRIAVFASHNGSDLQAIIDACKSGALDASVCVVISNNGGSRALERARDAGIPGYPMNVGVYGSEEALSDKMLEVLDDYKTEVIMLAGYLKKMSGKVLQRYHNRVFNIHPALLPKYGGEGMYGIRVHQAVIDAGEKESGITIHRANAAYDEGEIVSQVRIPVLEEDTADTLAAKILKQEHIFIVDVLNKIVKGEIPIGAEK